MTFTSAKLRDRASRATCYAYADVGQWLVVWLDGPNAGREAYVDPSTLERA